MSARYAIYFVPEAQTPLARLGSALLGRDSETGEDIPQFQLTGTDRDALFSLTTDARRYGLHATLKAPFFLKPGLSEGDLLQAAEGFVQGRRALSLVLTLPRLEVVRIGSLFALAPAGDSAEEQQAVTGVNALAAEAVSFFDAFRAAPAEQETARRRPHTLSARQRELLAAWGYPYVFDEYRFHMTLTDKIADPDAARVIEEGLRAYFRTVLSRPVAVNGICVCRQEVGLSGSGVFTLLRRFPIFSLSAPAL